VELEGEAGGDRDDRWMVDLGGHGGLSGMWEGVCLGVVCSMLVEENASLLGLVRYSAMLCYCCSAMVFGTLAKVEFIFLAFWLFAFAILE